MARPDQSKPFRAPPRELPQPGARPVHGLAMCLRHTALAAVNTTCLHRLGRRGRCLHSLEALKGLQGLQRVEQRQQGGGHRQQQAQAAAAAEAGTRHRATRPAPPSGRAAGGMSTRTNLKGFSRGGRPAAWRATGRPQGCTTQASALSLQAAVPTPTCLLLLRDSLLSCAVRDSAMVPAAAATPCLRRLLGWLLGS